MNIPFPLSSKEKKRIRGQIRSQRQRYYSILQLKVTRRGTEGGQDEGVKQVLGQDVTGEMCGVGLWRMWGENRERDKERQPVKVSGLRENIRFLPGNSGSACTVTDSKSRPSRNSRSAQREVLPRVLVWLMRWVSFIPCVLP